MTGTLPASGAPPEGALPGPSDVHVADVDAPASDGARDLRAPRAVEPSVRPWSAVVCGLPGDQTLLVVDWLLLACRAAGLVAQAMPLGGGADDPHGMYVEVAGDAGAEQSFSEAPCGAVDLLVAGEHLELARAIARGHADPAVTTIVASCRRAFTGAEAARMPQDVVREQEIDDLAARSSRAYHAFDGPEVAGWYQLPARVQPGLLLGAIFGSGATPLGLDLAHRAIDELGIDPELHHEGIRRGMRLGRVRGGRIRRPRTAYQFTRRRRANVDHRSRAAFEQLVAQADEAVHPAHLGVLQEAIYQLCLFQDAAWANVLMGHVLDAARIEHERWGDVDPADSIVPDVIRSLACLLVWPDLAWVASRKLRPGRMREVRAHHGIRRTDAWELREHVPIDATDRAAAMHPRLAERVDTSRPSIIQPLQVRVVASTSLAGALTLRRWARSARHRATGDRCRVELDTVEAWLHALKDALGVDHELARITARSGTLVQGAGAVRDANRVTAMTFWGRVVRQSLAIDRSSPTGEPEVARIVVRHAWNELCGSGPLALWEIAAQVLGIGLAHARGVSWEQTRELAVQLCVPRQPASG